MTLTIFLPIAQGRGISVPFVVRGRAIFGESVQNVSKLWVSFSEILRTSFVCFSEIFVELWFLFWNSFANV